MDHIKIDFSDEAISNYRKLAEILETNKLIRFDMTVYALNSKVHAFPPRGAERYNSCETIACALGWGAITGVGGTNFDSYTDYYVKNFRGLAGDDEHLSYNWCFHAFWDSVDPTPQGAAARIRYMLEHGIPEGYEWQLAGEGEYIFKSEVLGWKKELEG